MEVKPGYKQTEVGVIPKEWDESTVADVITSFRNGFAFASHGYVKSGIPIVTMAQIGLDGRFNFMPESVNYWPAEAASALVAFQLFRGDIIIAMTDVTPQKNLIGRMAEVTENGPLLLNQRVGLLRLNSEKIEPYFLRAISNSSRWRGYARAVASLGVQANIGTKDIRAGKIPLPPLPEQHAIATALSDLDGLLGGLDRLIAKKRDLKQAVMQQLLTGQTRLPGFNGEWQVKRLGEVIHLIRGGIYGDEKPHTGLSAFSVATTAHIEMDDTWNTKEMPVRYFTAEKLRNYATVEGDLIVVKSSGSAASIQSGKLGFIDTERAGKFVFSNFLMLLRPTGVFPRFLYFYLCSHNVKKLLPTLVEASTYPNIRLGDYLAVEIPVPPFPEQIAVAEVLTEIDGELAVLGQRREKTRALKQAMMQELLTGRTRLV